MHHKWAVYANQQKFGNVMQQISDFVAREALEDGKPQLVTVSPLHEARRTDAQNRFMWPMMQQIADGMNAVQQQADALITKEHVKVYLVRKYFGVDRREIDGEPVVIEKSTAKMSRSEMIYLIDSAMAWAADRGFAVMVPKEYQEWARE